MLDSTTAILSFVNGKRRKDLESNRMLLSAIIRELEILGEAAGKISLETQNLYPDLPWRKVIGMRNRLIHAYFDVDPDVVWKTIQNGLPSLSEELKKIIANWGQA
jgi:uncharacterized protein with HEPN domain